jgi:hypothetical protein
MVPGQDPRVCIRQARRHGVHALAIWIQEAIRFPPPDTFSGIHIGHPLRCRRQVTGRSEAKTPDGHEEPGKDPAAAPRLPRALKTDSAASPHGGRRDDNEKHGGGVGAILVFCQAWGRRGRSGFQPENQNGPYRDCGGR